MSRSSSAERPAILVLGARSERLALRLMAALPGAERHAPACAACSAEIRFEKVTDHLRALFAEGRPIVGICASGILIRALAPLLTDKRVEPPVLAVAEDGSAVVPLLGGHHGANTLARTIAAALDVAAAITTAGDLRLGLALDEPPAGWRLADPEAAKGFTAALLEGASVRLTVEAGDAAWLRQLPVDPTAAIEILTTHRAVATAPERLAFHPPVLAVGVGAERGAEPEALLDLVHTTLAEAGLAEGAIACITSIDLKADEPAVHALAAALDVPARFLGADRLLEETERLTTRSEIVFRETGCWGVAEGAALAAAGPGARLLVPKRRGRRVTCAVALAASDIDPATVGRPQGSLAVVGIGPGSPAWRTREAEAVLREADEVVGYGLYLDLAADLLAGAAQHRFPLGAEEDRCRKALDLAATGRRVALVSSGDPGIYAMAALVLELLDREEKPAWRRVALRICPGISALQAAAARLGAPLGHDFCAISLSDLMTPWPVIERRLQAAAEGDFVLALYNPVSARRRQGLERAKEILLAFRPPSTPVILARNLGRAEEHCRVTTLDALTVDEVDMLTLVLVGSTTTRRLATGAGPDRVYTPRGYGVP